jgi:hypothetical protein
MSSEDTDALVKEHIALQNELREYIAKNGFDYAEYSAAPEGSYYAKYRKRWTEITRSIAPAMHEEDY